MRRKRTWMAVGLVIGLWAAVAAGPASHVRATTSLTPDWVVQARTGANHIVFLDSRTGWGAGGHPSLQVTHDGGDTWSTYVPTAPDSLRRVLFFNSDTGVVFGDSNFLLTNNGGSSWASVAVPSDLRVLNDVAHPQPHEYFLATNNGLYGSVNDGATWQVIPSLSDGFGGYSIGHVTFSSPTEGWAAGISDTPLYHTTDGGNTWTNVQNGVKPIDAIAFPSSSTGFLAGGTNDDNILLSRTTDGGTTWTNSQINGEGSSVSIAFATPLRGIISGGTGIAMTDDGGVTWHDQTVPSKLTQIASVGFRGSEPYAVTTYGSILHLGPLPSSAPPTATYLPQNPVATDTPTASETPAPTETPIPTDTPTDVPSLTPLPTRTPFPTETPLPRLTLRSLSARTVIAGTAVRLVIAGSGFDNLATVTLGDADITDGIISPGTLRFLLPRSLRPGTYDVVVTEPDGRTASLVRALVVQPRLTLAAHLTRPSAAQGGTAIVLAQSVIGAQLTAQVTTSAGHALPHVTLTTQQGAVGQWRIVARIGAHVSPGNARITLRVKLGAQQIQMSLPLRIGVG